MNDKIKKGTEMNPSMLYWTTNIKTREAAKRKLRTSSGTIHPHIRVE